MRKTILRASLIAMLGSVCGNDFVNVMASEETLSFVQSEKVDELIGEFDLLDHSDKSKVIAILTERLSSGISPEEGELRKQIKYYLGKDDIRSIVRSSMPQCVKFADECNKPVFQWVCEEVLRDNDEAKGKILAMLYGDVFDCSNYVVFPELVPIIVYDDRDAFIKLASDPSFKYSEDALRLAALAGAAKVFKQIVMGGTLPMGLDWKKSRGLFGAALVGGNLEIIRICEQNGVTNLEEKFGRLALSGTPGGFITPDIAEWLWTQGLIPSEMIDRWIVMFIDSGNTEVVKRLVDLVEGFDVNHTPNTECSLLRRAVSRENIDIVRFLIEKGANVNEPCPDVNARYASYNSEPPLFLAAEMGYTDIVKCLVENGANVNTPSFLGRTPLMAAARHHGNIDIVKYLVENGADVNAGSSPLVEAIDFQDMDTVKYLVENGAKINTKNFLGIPPIYKAIEVGNLDILKYLVESGVKIRDTMISYTGRDEIRRYLEKKKAEQDAQK